MSSSCIMDIEELEKRGQEMVHRKINKPTLEDAMKYRDLVADLLAGRNISATKRKHKLVEKNSYIYHAYTLLIKQGHIEHNVANDGRLCKALQIKPCKSWSGITSITVFTTAYPEYTRESDGVRVKQPFSCAFSCNFCPNQPGQPRSYILNEPGILRATRNDHQCVPQMHDRLNALYSIGHTSLGKLEVLVLGGTFASYPVEYRREFARDIFYAANTFWDPDTTPLREPLSLEQEKEINTVAKSRVIGITFETRGDTINTSELRLYRELGCTRIQMGIQHIDDAILKKNNRQCPHQKTVTAIKLLKENGFKIDGHFMPNLPGATPAADHDMMIDNLLGVRSHVRGSHFVDEEYVLANPDIQVDQVKIYPTAVLPYTEIEKWFLDGSYVPYSDQLVKELVIKVKSLMFPFIRINRIIRDFFPEAIYAGGGKEMVGLRPEAQSEMSSAGRVICKCIRCRENKAAAWDGSYVVHVIKYNASGGDEYFISAESEDCKTLYGFARLRLDSAFNKVFMELNQAALLRELHVYSQSTFVGDKGLAVQHRGLGSRLMAEAEAIARRHHYYKMAVISGVGARTFYKRIGYVLNEGGGEFMMKKI